MRLWEYRIYWKDGWVETITGYNYSDALMRNGYGVEAIPLIAHYHTFNTDKGDEYEWDVKKNEWIPTS